MAASGVTYLAAYTTFDRRDVAGTIRRHDSFAEMQQFARVTGAETFQALIPSEDMPASEDQLLGQLAARIELLAGLDL